MIFKCAKCKDTFYWLDRLENEAGEICCPFCGCADTREIDGEDGGLDDDSEDADADLKDALADIATPLELGRYL